MDWTILVTAHYATLVWEKYGITTELIFNVFFYNLPHQMFPSIFKSYRNFAGDI